MARCPMRQLGAKLADYVWIILMGNDALDRMPDCAQQGKRCHAHAPHAIEGNGPPKAVLPPPLLASPPASFSSSCEPPA